MSEWIMHAAPIRGKIRALQAMALVPKAVADVAICVYLTESHLGGGSRGQFPALRDVLEIDQHYVVLLDRKIYAALA